MKFKIKVTLIVLFGIFTTELFCIDFNFNKKDSEIEQYHQKAIDIHNSNPKEALRYLNSALVIAKHEDNIEQEIRTINYLGIINAKNNQKEIARKYFEEALSLAEYQNYDLLKAEALNYLSNIERAENNYIKAIENYYEMLFIYKKEELEQEYITTIISIARSLKNLNRIEEALELISEIESDYNISSTTEFEIQLLKASLYWKIKEYSESNEIYDSLLEINSANLDQNIFQIYHNIALNFFNLNKYDSAKYYFEYSLKYTNSQYDSILTKINLANNYYSIGDNNNVAKILKQLHYEITNTIYDDFLFEYYFLDFNIDPDTSKLSLLENCIGDDIENKINFLNLSIKNAYEMKDYEKINSLSRDLQNVYESQITKSADIDFELDSFQNKYQENLKNYQLAENKKQYNYVIIALGLFIIISLMLFKSLYKNKVIEIEKNNEIIIKYSNISMARNEFDSENYMKTVLIPLTYELARIEDEDQFEKLSSIYNKLQREFDILVNFNNQTKEILKDVSRNKLQS